MSQHRQHVKVYLHDDWLEAIRLQAEKKKVCVSEFIRQCISKQLPKKRLSEHRRGRPTGENQ
jgi:hypothetical protein